MSPAEARSRKSSSPISEAVDEALISPPVADEVCFSPDERCDIKLEKFTAAATRSLDIAIYDISLDQLAHIIAVQSKKIRVRVLVDKRQSKEKNSLVDLLVKAGVEVRFGSQRGIMHNKFTVRDGEMVEAGSFNYTNHATESNNENQVYLADPAIVKRYQDRFETIWAVGKPVQ